VIRLEEVSYWYPGQALPAVAGVTLEVAPGEVVGLTGANECGKTTVCLLAAGLASSMNLLFLVPVAAGMLVGWRAVRTVARLSSWQVKARTAATASVVAALTLTLASALAGGSLGAARLSAVGAPSLLFGLAVLGELLVGASIVVGLSHLRAVRR